MNHEVTDLAAVLNRTRLLSGLSDPELQLLAKCTVRKLFSAGELLFAEGLLEVEARRIVIEDMKALAGMFDIAA